MTASGPFDVKLIPQPGEDTVLGRLTLDKVFHGDLEATSKGQSTHVLEYTIAGAA